MAKKITIDLEAGTASFISGMDKAGKSLDGVGEHAHGASTALDHLKEGFEIGAGIEAFKAGLESVKVVVEQVEKALEDVGAIGRNALKLGVSAEEMSRFQHAANATHTDIGALTSGIDRLSAGIGKVVSGDASAGAIGKALQSLGLNARELADENPADVFKQVAEALTHVESTTARANIQRELFGKGGKELLPLMGDLNALMKESDDIGFTRTAEQIEQAEKEERKLAAAVDTVKGLLMDLATSPWAASLISGIKQAANAFTELMGPNLIDKANGKALQDIAHIKDDREQMPEAKKQSYDRSNLDNQIEGMKKVVELSKDEAEHLADLRTQQRLAGNPVTVSNEDIKYAQNVAKNHENILKILLGQKHAIEDAKAAESAAADERSKNISKAADAVAKLKQQVATFGMTAGQKQLFDLKNMPDITKGQIDQAKGYERQLQGLETAKKVAEETKRLQDQIAQKSGGDDFTRKGEELIAAGAKSQDVANLVKLHDQLTKIEKDQKNVAEAKKLWEEAETPLQKYNDKLKELDQLQKSGALSAEQYQQIKLKADRELAKSQPAAETREAAMVSRQFNFKMPGQSGENPQKKMLKLQEQQAQKFQNWDVWFQQIYQKVTGDDAPTVLDLEGV